MTANRFARAAEPAFQLAVPMQQYVLHTFVARLSTCHSHDICYKSPGVTACKHTSLYNLHHATSAGRVTP